LTPYPGINQSISLKTTLSLGTIFFLSLFAKGDQYLRQSLLFLQCHVTPLLAKQSMKIPTSAVLSGTCHAHQQAISLYQLSQP